MKKLVLVCVLMFLGAFIGVAINAKISDVRAVEVVSPVAAPIVQKVEEGNFITAEDRLGLYINDIPGTVTITNSSKKSVEFFTLLEDIDIEGKGFVQEDGFVQSLTIIHKGSFNWNKSLEVLVLRLVPGMNLDTYCIAISDAEETLKDGKQRRRIFMNGRKVLSTEVNITKEKEVSISIQSIETFGK